MDLAALSHWLSRLAAVLRLPTDRYDPEDLAQDVCVELSRAPELVRGSTLDQVKPWARQVLVTKIVDHRRREKRAKRDRFREVLAGGAELIDRIADPGPSPSWTAAKKERAAIIRDAIKQLTPDQREIVRLHDLEGLALTEIAALKETSTASVSRLHTRALRALWKLLPRPD